jgi:hypothetical protein
VVWEGCSRETAPYPDSPAASTTKLTIERDRHSWFELRELAFGLDPHAQGVAIVRADGALGLPGRE